MLSLGAGAARVAGPNEVKERYMKLSWYMSALLAGAVSVSASVASASDLPSPSDNDPSKINISCYRGAMKTVAWDRPNAVFLDDLVQLGYSREMASNIGERVCRDEYGVRNPDHQVRSLLKILRESPPG